MANQPTLLEFNYQRLTSIKHSILEGSVLVSIFRQEYPDIPEMETAYWHMVALGDYLKAIQLKMERKIEDDARSAD